VFVFAGLIAVAFVLILFVVWGVKPADQSVKKEMDAFYKNGCPYCGSEDFNLSYFYHEWLPKDAYQPQIDEGTVLKCARCQKFLASDGHIDSTPIGVKKIKTLEAAQYYNVAVQKRHPGSGSSSCVYLLIFLMIPVILFFCVIIFSSLLDIQL
jgi:DNA-directed RNA polymerase subunit RPC12/RpoP